ncbi:transglycosylase, partial [Mycobacterium avium 10-5581]
ISERRNVELAQLIQQGSAGYGGMGGGAPMAGGSPMMGGTPMGMGGGGLGSPMMLPRLSAALSALNRDHHGQRGDKLTLASEPTGPGAERVRAAIRKALDIEGIHDPTARARWEAGMMVVAKRESGFNNGAVNHSDSNAAKGDPSDGSFQFTGATFRQYHQPGTSGSRSDDVAEACAFINYARGRYHVASDASNLAANIQQADPTRPPKGY